MSILAASRKDMEYTKTIIVNGASASTIIRNVYESFRMLGDALCVARGKESKDHITSIEEIYTIRADTPRPLRTIDNQRQLRHNINYYGYQPTMAEAEDVMSFARSCFDILAKAIEKDIKKE
jgi:uncharacterized protein (UPF0332 family)